MAFRKEPEDTVNFMPLGEPKGMKFAVSQIKKVQGQTPEERKRIARDVRRAARKEKKTIKADAKRQRKLNAIMNRRMTKNPEKYSKNKERNKIRAIEAERTKIRHAAIRQAERLAAKHDPSGKMFNVGEVIVLEDGSVKNKNAYAIAQERRAQKKAAKAAIELEAQQATPGAPQEKPKKGPSKRQQARQEVFAPRPPPARPVIPEGISLPAGEEDFTAMWEITDEGIQKRLSKEKRVKSQARKNLRRQQKEQKRFNQAMKLFKKQTENRGETWDKEKGRRIVLKMQEGADSEEDSQDSGSDSDSGNGDESAKVEQPVASPKVEKSSKKSNKAEENGRTSSNGEAVVEFAAPLPEPEFTKKKKSKRPAEEDASVEEPRSKKSKKSKKSDKSDEEEVEAVETPAAEQPEAPLDKKQRKQMAEEAYSKLTVEEKLAIREEKRVKREEKAAKKASKAARKEDRKLKKQVKKARESGHYFLGTSASKKRKNDDNEVEDPVEEKSHKKHKSVVEEGPVNGSSEAAQWNPNALTGDESRRKKFLRLLGVKKTNNGVTDGANHKSTAKAADIEKVQTDLERQYEAGMKMKHDGGGKRRGLGA